MGLLRYGEKEDEIMFKCKVCAEKDKRIADLQHMISLLQPHNGQSIPLVQLEADQILNGNDQVIELAKSPEKIDEAESELNRILSGTY